ncbi:MAG: redoxin domain-containing protein [Planctomycetes bacterium]|nr:redoxin domain-containing protein [Planctomycetota bacterium]
MPALVATSIASVAALSAAPADFAVTSSDKSFRLSEARGTFVALHFLLKTDCPYCQRYVADIVRRAPDVAGVTHIFLKPDSEEEVKAWSEKLKQAGVDATIYRDPDAKLADEFRIPDGYAFHGQTVHFPALVLLGPEGREAFRYVGKDNTDRLPFDQLAAKIAELSKNAAIAEYNLSDRAMALGGFDPVAYIDAGQARPGKPELTSRYRGVAYRFESKQNQRKFADNPGKYVPAYGGWCATAMADGRKVEVDPENFKVTDGRLFLFYKGWLGDARKDWNKDEKKLTARANEQWRRIAPTDAIERK